MRSGAASTTAAQTKGEGVAEASFGPPLHALAVGNVRAGLQRERGHGWEFIDLAALGNNNARSYVIGLLRIVLYPIGFVVAVGLGIGIAIAVAAALTHKPPQGIGPIAGT